MSGRRPARPGRPRRIVVVGGDAAGMSAAHTALRAARAAEEPVEITVLEATQHTSYSACGLPYWIAGEVGSGDDLVARTPEQHRAAGVLEGALTADQIYMNYRNNLEFTFRGKQVPPKVREFLDRGYTLAAVEKAVLSSPVAATGPALDLLQLLDEPGRDVEPEVMTRDALAALAHVPREDALIDALVDFGLVEWIDGDDESVRVLYPAIVRNGAAAVSLGLPAAEVIALFPAIRDHLRAVADEFVGRAVSTIIRPFIDRGLPAQDAPAVLSTVEQLLPVASQVTYAMFRHELSAAIEQEIGAQLDEIGSQLRGE